MDHHFCTLANVWNFFGAKLFFQYHFNSFLIKGIIFQFSDLENTLNNPSYLFMYVVNI
jgi:hypothetical protein